MPEDFNFDEVPDFKFKVRASLPGLKLKLWQPSTVAKIASIVGTLVEVDHRTVARINIDDMRFHVIVDEKKSPPENIKIKLPSAKIITQKITFDFYPLYCLKSRRMGHNSISCRALNKTGPSMRATSRGGPNAGRKNKEEWKMVRGRKGINNTTIGKEGGTSTNNERRSKSRPPTGQRGESNRTRSRPHTAPPPQVPNRPAAMLHGAIPTEINNTHNYISSPTHGSGEKASFVDAGANGDKVTDKDILIVVEEAFNINPQELDKSMHSDMPSHVSECLLVEPNEEKNN